MALCDSPWLDSDQAARYLSITRRALYQRIRRGQIPAYRFGRSLRFHRDELDAVLAGGGNPLTDRVRSLLQRPSARRKGAM